MIVELLFGYISLLYSIIINTLCFEKSMNIKSVNHNYKYFLVIVLFSILNIINKFAFNDFLNVYVCMLLFILIYKIIYKTDNKETIVCALILTASSIFVELLFTAVLSVIFPKMKMLNEDYLYTTIITMLFSTVLYLIIKIPKVNNLLYKLIKTLKSKVSIELFLGFIIVLINLMSVLYGDDYKNFKFFFIITLSLISLISLILLIVCLILSKGKVELQNRVLINYIEEFEKIADDYKELQHNLTNDLLAIKTIGDEKVQDLVDEKIKKYHKNYNWLTNITSIPKGLQGLIYLKMNSINKNKIAFQIESMIEETIVELMSSKDYSDLCDVLGIIIDNAIEATKETKEKTLFININNIKNNLQIQVINNYKNIIDINNIGKKHYSTKQKKSGLGLSYVNKVAKKKLKVKKEILNDLFIVSINVPLMVKSI